MNCPECKTEIESGFDTCWKCGWSIYDETPVEEQEISDDDLPCLRCGTALEFAGNFEFHEGTRMGVLGNIAELFVNKESFDIYICPNCSKAEFYAPKKNR